MRSARQRIAPVVDDAREKVAPAAGQARAVLADDVVPKVTTAVSMAVTASKPYRTEARRRGSAAVAALRGEVGRARSRRRWPKVLMLTGAVGAAALGAYRWLRARTDRQWQPLVTNPPSPPASEATTSGAGRKLGDVTGASPDEGLADATTPRPSSGPTTPGESGAIPPQKSGDDAGSSDAGSHRRADRSSQDPGARGGRRGE
jgi:hypothetical protein